MKHGEVSTYIDVTAGISCRQDRRSASPEKGGAMADHVIKPGPKRLCDAAIGMQADKVIGEGAVILCKGPADEHIVTAVWRHGDTEGIVVEPPTLIEDYGFAILVASTR
jgi:hypothetical protein